MDPNQYPNFNNGQSQPNSNPPQPQYQNGSSSDNTFTQQGHSSFVQPSSHTTSQLNANQSYQASPSLSLQALNRSEGSITPGGQTTVTTPNQSGNLPIQPHQASIASPLGGTHPMNQMLHNDQITAIFARINHLKTLGAPQNLDPEYFKLIEFLKAYSNYKNKLKAQRGLVDGPIPLQQSSGALTQSNQQMMERKDSFNESQISQLSNQISAYKYISKGLPMPAQVKPFDANILLDHKTATPNKLGPDTVAAKIASGEIHNKAQMAQPNSGKSHPELNKFGYLNPYSLLGNPKVKLQRHIIPSIMPSGLDPYAVAKEREDRLKSRIQSRIKELEGLPSSLANESATEFIEETLELADPFEKGKYSAKLKAVIELKSLRLVGFQRRMREQMFKSMSKSSNLITTVDRHSFRRMKRQTLKEARYTEKLEKQQRAEREKKERQKHLDLLTSIVRHGKDMIQANKNQQARTIKVGKLAIAFHNTAKNDMNKKNDEEQKKRLEALKTGNEEEYLKYLDSSRDTRITQLLGQTETFLSSLTDSVLEQQNDDAYYMTTKDTQVNDDDTEEPHDGDYYSIAHRIKETITEQPGILVGGKLKDYQIKGLQWMVSLYNNRLNGILADEMGLGKTIQTISFVSHLIELKRQNGPYLILVPLSTLPNWSMEFDKWAPSIVKVVYKGDPAQRKAVYRDHIKHGNFQVLITTFEFVIKDKSVLSKVKWLHMIIDEGHRMKNTESKLSITLNKHYSTRYRLILTGTPLQNNLPELWALLNFVLPRVFNSAATFEEWFNTPFANSGTHDKIELNEEEKLLIIKRLHKVLRPFLLRRLKRDVESELPDKVEKIIKCKMSILQHKVYQRIQRRESVIIQNDTKNKVGVRGLNNTIMQLRKVCNHPFVFSDVENIINPANVNNEMLYRVSGKFELLDRVLFKFFATGHRVLIFFQMTSIMSIFEDYMNFKGVKYLRLDGTTKQDERADYLKMFNSPDSPYQLFMLSTRAGGLGLNLQTADTVIIFDSDWNPHQDLQAQDRAHRIGQKKDVLILRLITTNSVEEKILERAQFKLDMDGKVIQAGKFDNKSTAEEREALLRSLLVSDSPDDTPDENEAEEEDMNEIIARSEEEIEIFRNLDKERHAEELAIWEAANNSGPVPERLIQESELPVAFLLEKTDINYEKEEPESFGVGRRVKDRILYDDGLTEEQFCEAVDNENVNLNEVIEIKKEKRLRRIKNKLIKEGVLEVEPQLSSSEQGIKRRKPRSSRFVNDDSCATPVKRSKVDNMLPQQRKQFTHKLKNCLLSMENLIDPSIPERRVAELFDKKPNRKWYPDYYALILNPISLFEIKKKIKSEQYNSSEELKEDAMLMFSNARTYNEEGSMVYNDSQMLEDVFMETYHANFPTQSSPKLSSNPDSEVGSQVQPNSRSPAKSKSITPPPRHSQRHHTLVISSSSEDELEVHTIPRVNIVRPQIPPPQSPPTSSSLGSSPRNFNELSDTSED